MKLTKMLYEDVTAQSQVLILFDKLSKSPGFVTMLSKITNPPDKYLAIIEFSKLLGIPESKFQDFITNMQSRVNQEQ